MYGLDPKFSPYMCVVFTVTYFFFKGDAHRIPVSHLVPEGVWLPQGSAGGHEQGLEHHLDGKARLAHHVVREARAYLF